MKLVMIMYNEAINDEVESLLEQNSVDGFTKWTKVYGKGRTSGPHLGTHIWPKVNNVLAVLTEERATDKILQDIRELRKRFAKEGVKAFTWQIDEVI
jgi:nitrogen regulatory protein PII